jgi:polyhydroxyalkanoate synthesis regulator phasin
MKTNVNMTIDADIMAELREKGLKISPLINTFLRGIINSPEIEKQQSVFETESQILKLKTQVADLEDHKRKLEKKTVIIRE